MSDELKDILKRKNEEIERLKNQKTVLFNQLYQAKQDLSRLKDTIRSSDDPEEALKEPSDKREVEESDTT